MTSDTLLACRSAIKNNPGKVYVYVLSRPDGTPFYVGIGTRGRISCHERDAVKGLASRKSRIIRKIVGNGEQIKYKIDSWHDDWSVASAREVELIALIGRLDLKSGPLANSTAGGDGASSPGPEARKKQAANTQERWKDPAYRERMSAQGAWEAFEAALVGTLSR